MNPLYQTVRRERIPVNTFPAGGERKLSMKMGQIIPIYCEETLPGDIFRASTELLIKFAPLKAPVMHRIRAYVDYFFVPNFQICKSFDQFINPRINTASSPVILPYIRPYDAHTWLNQLEKGTLADYLDLPVQQTAWKTSEISDPLSVLPFRAYQHIYNSYFRDQTLQPMEGVAADETDLYLMQDIDKQGDVFEFNPDGSTTVGQEEQLNNMMQLRYSAWKKDYFTSALPTPQAGEEVEVPFTPGVIRSTGLPMKFEDLESGGPYEQQSMSAGFNDNEDGTFDLFMDTGEGQPSMGYASGLEIAPSTEGGSSLSINGLRQLFALQHFKELQGRGGSRYPEVVHNFFGVQLPDLYVDRPAYLGGMYQDVAVGEVLQTSQTTLGDSGSAQGYRAGVASVYGKSKTLRYRCRMHGFIIGVLRVLPEATYMQGVERMWTRTSLFDYAWPQFANIGEQEIYNREIYVDGTEADREVFGYAPRYAEYKSGCSHVNGEFRDELSYWHFGRKFSERPLLNEDFIMANQISTDPFNVTSNDVDKLYVHMYTKAAVRRSLPYYGTPGLTKL